MKKVTVVRHKFTDGDAVIINTGERGRVARVLIGEKSRRGICGAIYDVELASSGAMLRGFMEDELKKAKA